MKTEKLKEEIEKKFKPKVLNIDNLVKENIILTDSYSWRDFKEAISEAIEKSRTETIEDFIKIIDEILNDDDDYIANYFGIDEDIIADGKRIFRQLKKELKQKLKEKNEN